MLRGFGGVSRRGIAFSVALTALFLSPASPLAAQQMGQSYQQFEIDRGATLYSSNCMECHTDGAGVPGVNFRTGQFPQGSSDQDIISAIHNGIPGTTMPPHDFDGAALTALAAYIRSLAQTDTVPIKLGDPEKGRALFQQNGCLNCHRVGSEGAHSALNLSDTGALHPPSYLQRALLDPNAIMAATPESRLVRVVTNEGKTITGRRMNEDTYTLQIIDDHENLVSLHKSDLKSVTILKESPMPSEKGHLTTDQLSDLVAFLASLKGSRQVVTQFGASPKIGSAYVNERGRGGFAAPANSPGSPPVAPSPAPAVPQTSGGTR
jgi:putative heme-binding domain-containing protein